MTSSVKHDRSRSQQVDAQSVLASAGINHEHVDFSIVGVYQRLPTCDKPAKRNGSVRIDSLHPLELWYQNFATGVNGYFRAEAGKGLRVSGVAADAAKRFQRQCLVARESRNKWRKAPKASESHDYFLSKAIKPHGLRQQGRTLLVPMVSNRVIHNLQKIYPDGTKRFMAGGRKRGCYYPLGQASSAIVLCEGFSTGASLAECLNLPVVICFDCHNLQPVAHCLSVRFPQSQLVFCADNDVKTRGNPGLTCASRAAKHFGGVVAVPDFGTQASIEKLTDFNDLHRLSGGKAVLNCVLEQVPKLFDYQVSHRAQ